MGFFSRLVTGEAKPASDPQVDLISELLQDQRQQRAETSRILDRVLDQAAQQNQLMQQMMGQYVAKGENQTTTLESRLFAKDEKLEDDMWESIGENPFKQLGMTD